MRFETLAVHAGEREVKRGNRSVTIPMEQTAAYYFDSTQQIHLFYAGRLGGVKYGRYGCPTQHAVENKLACLEGAKRGLIFPSGMNAVSTSLLALLKTGQHIIFTDDCYRNTRRFIKEDLKDLGIQSTEVSINRLKDLKKFFKKNTRLFFSEIPTNPFLRVIDLEHVVKVCAERDIVSIIDSTFATPVNLKPLEYGTDLVLHSATKYIGGHHDLMAGAVIGNEELIGKIQTKRDVIGGICDPHTSYLLLRSIKTLPIRMKEHNERALQIARYLEKHPKVERLWYPGCVSHPDYELAKKQMTGFGGVVTFLLRANEHDTSKFIDALKIPYISTNFGGPESLIEQHAVLTYYLDRTFAKKRGITGNLIRLSVGFEDSEDLIKDFERGFRKLK